VKWCAGNWREHHELCARVDGGDDEAVPTGTSPAATPKSCRLRVSGAGAKALAPRNGAAPQAFLATTTFMTEVEPGELWLSPCEHTTMAPSLMMFSCTSLLQLWARIWSLLAALSSASYLCLATYDVYWLSHALAPSRCSTHCPSLVLCSHAASQARTHKNLQR